MKRVLMVAFHFPPLAGSSGIQRTLRFVQHLPDFGWQPVVLTADPNAYEKTSDDLLREVPSQVPVIRAFALDTARQLKVGGRYFAWMARPDRWMTWRFDGVRKGLSIIDRLRPQVLWSTYPIATAHVIAQALHRRRGLPWIADFRDPMAQEGYPQDPVTWRQFERIESAAMDEAAQCVFTTPGAARLYRQRYPTAKAGVKVIENGYDEESFAALSTTQARRDGPMTLLHSGIVYPSERDPQHLMRALAMLRDAYGVSPEVLRVRFRAAVHDDLLVELASQHGVESYIELAASIPYRQALAEMTSVTALLVLQASNCNEQIPAKLYEYLRAGRPILGLCDPSGDTAAALGAARVPYLAPLDDADLIAKSLLSLLRDWQAERVVLPDPNAVAAASRHSRAAELAALLDRASAETAV